VKKRVSDPSSKRMALKKGGDQVLEDKKKNLFQEKSHSYSSGDKKVGWEEPRRVGVGVNLQRKTWGKNVGNHSVQAVFIKRRARCESRQGLGCMWSGGLTWWGGCQTTFPVQTAPNGLFDAICLQY